MYSYKADDMQSIVKEFIKLDKISSDVLRNHKEANELKADYYRWEFFFLTYYLGLSVIFTMAIGVQPLFSDQPMPFRSKYPFGWDDIKQHPFMYRIIYTYQVICTLYVLLAVNVMDSVLCNMFKETSLNLKLLALRIRVLLSQSETKNNRRRDIQYHQKRLKDLHSVIKLHQRIIGYK